MSGSSNPQSTRSFGERPTWMPDIYTTSRKDYTQLIVERQVPEDAVKEYAIKVKQQQKLVKMLYDDPAMESNREQTFMTPANSKNRVYFMWDFCQRNLIIMLSLDPKLPAIQKKEWEGVVERCGFATILILDGSGKVDTMFPGDKLKYSEEIRAFAKSTQDD